MFLKDLLFPKICVGCGFVGVYVCLNCQQKLVSIDKDICLYCGKTSKFGLTHYGCRKKYGIDGIMALYKYNSILQKIIKTLKYRLAKDIWEELLNIVYVEAQNKLRDLKPIIYDPHIQPIPIYKGKINKRGFNQVDLIAGLVQTIIDGKIINVLEKSVNSPPQAEMVDRRLRQKNIKNTYRVKDKNEIRKKKIILIDDIYTSGATVKEAVNVLKKAGASFVFAITLAKG